MGPVISSIEHWNPFLGSPKERHPNPPKGEWGSLVFPLKQPKLSEPPCGSKNEELGSRKRVIVLPFLPGCRLGYHVFMVVVGKDVTFLLIVV